jgi:L-alanine-DL-glutamate epimerase-like enolase superfamily enzyme
MIIEQVKVWKTDLENKRPYTIAFKTIDKVENVFLSITLKNGTVGLGSCNPSQPVVGESLDQAYEKAQEAEEWLKGRDINNFEDLLRENLARTPKNPGARSVVDVALHDAFTQLLDVSVVNFLGRRVESLPTSVTIGIKDVQSTVEEGEEFVSMGFKSLKVKLGHSVKTDVERLVALRKEFGDAVAIRVDANQGYSSDQLMWFFNETKSLNLELIEQPMKMDDIAGVKSLPEEVRRVIAMDESIQILEDAILHVTPPISSGIMNIKLMKSGGIYEGKRIAGVAESSGVELMWGCNDESKVSITAALHAAYSSPNTRYIDLDGSFDLAKDIVSGGFELKDGKMYPLEKPGLGLELN